MRRWTQETVATVEKMRTDGLTYRQIAERWQMTEEGLRSIFNRYKRRFKAEAQAEKDAGPCP